MSEAQYKYPSKAYVVTKPNDESIYGVFLNRNEMMTEIETHEARLGYYIKWDERPDGVLYAVRFDGTIVFAIDVIHPNKLSTESELGARFVS